MEFGYPWSTLSETKRTGTDFHDLRKPGWIPTAVVLNILTKGTERNGAAIAAHDLATITEQNDLCTLNLPYEKWSASWSASKLPPFE